MKESKFLMLLEVIAEQISFFIETAFVNTFYNILSYWSSKLFKVFADGFEVESSLILL